MDFAAHGAVAREAADELPQPLALARVAVSRPALRELEAAHRALISMHLEKDLKSVRVLREMRR